MLYSGKSGCIREKMFVLKQNFIYSAKLFYSSKSFCNRTKVVVFGQTWLYSGKVVVFGQK